MLWWALCTGAYNLCSAGLNTQKFITNNKQQQQFLETKYKAKIHCQQTGILQKKYCNMVLLRMFSCFSFFFYFALIFMFFFLFLLCSDFYNISYIFHFALIWAFFPSPPAVNPSSRQCIFSIPFWVLVCICICIKI